MTNDSSSEDSKQPSRDSDCRSVVHFCSLTIPHLGPSLVMAVARCAGTVCRPCWLVHVAAAGQLWRKREAKREREERACPRSTVHAPYRGCFRPVFIKREAIERSVYGTCIYCTCIHLMCLVKKHLLGAFLSHYMSMLTL